MVHLLEHLVDYGSAVLRNMPARIQEPYPSDADPRQIIAPSQSPTIQSDQERHGSFRKQRTSKLIPNHVRIV